MNTKKITKIILALALIIMIIGVLGTVNAASSTGISIPTASPIQANQFQTVVGKIIWIVQFICYAAAVILLMTLGVKFITAAPEAKAEIKKSAIYYVIGAAMVFAAGIILNVINNVVTNIT